MMVFSVCLILHLNSFSALVYSLYVLFFIGMGAYQPPATLFIIFSVMQTSILYEFFLLLFEYD